MQEPASGLQHSSPCMQVTVQAQNPNLGSFCQSRGALVALSPRGAGEEERCEVIVIVILIHGVGVIVIAIVTDIAGFEPSMIFSLACVLSVSDVVVVKL